MTNKTYSVSLETAEGARRDVTVPSPTDVQAGDAARLLMGEGESIIAITALPRDDNRALDGEPPQSQAAELAPVTRGAAAAPAPPRAPDLDRS